MSTAKRRSTFIWPALVGRDDLLDLAGRRLAEVRQGRGRPHGACYTPALMAETGKSRAATATERARDGASRAGSAA